MDISIGVKKIANGYVIGCRAPGLGLLIGDETGVSEERHFADLAGVSEAIVPMIKEAFRLAEAEHAELHARQRGAMRGQMLNADPAYGTIGADVSAQRAVNARGY